MNIMRKLRSGTGGASNAGGASSQNISEGTDAASAQHNQLGLMHLKKLFTEYTHPKEPLSEVERDFKLYNMLPLFCKVCYIIIPLFGGGGIGTAKTIPLIEIEMKNCFAGVRHCPFH